MLGLLGEGLEVSTEVGVLIRWKGQEHVNESLSSQAKMPMDTSLGKGMQSPNGLFL